jgi:hypothetical protein
MILCNSEVLIAFKETISSEASLVSNQQESFPARMEKLFRVPNPASLVLIAQQPLKIHF